LPRVGEHLVGVVDLLEFGRSVGGLRHVGVMLLGRLAERRGSRRSLVPSRAYFSSSTPSRRTAWR
jgi:hypothetical protein